MASKPKKQPVNKSKAIVPVVQGEEVEIVSEREAPKERALSKSEVIGPVFNDAQLSILLNRTPKWAIKVRQGRGGNYKYVPHGYVTDTLNKAFGFNHDLFVNDIETGRKFTLVYEDVFDNKGVKVRVDRHIAIEGHIVVRIMNLKTGEVMYEITKHGFGSSMWLPGQELGDALKSARSDLVKTCAYQLGIALDLYWDERAEFEQWDEKEQKKKAREIMSKMRSEIPSTPILLISMADEKYGMEAEDIVEALGLDDFDEILTYNEEQVENAWEVIKAYQAAKANGKAKPAKKK